MYCMINIWTSLNAVTIFISIINYRSIQNSSVLRRIHFLQLRAQNRRGINELPKFPKKNVYYHRGEVRLKKKSISSIYMNSSFKNSYCFCMNYKLPINLEWFSITIHLLQPGAQNWWGINELASLGTTEMIQRRKKPITRQIRPNSRWKMTACVWTKIIDD